MKNDIIQHWLQHYGNNVEVYFSIYQDACQHCEKLFLTNGTGSEPVLYKLTEVIENELNVGGKIENLYPNGGVHNLCFNRTLTVKPPNSIWNPSQKQFVLVRNTCGVNRKSIIAVRVTKKY